MTPIAAEGRMLIDGNLVEAEGGRTYANVNPTTEEVIGQVADASVADMDRAGKDLQRLLMPSFDIC